MDPQRQRKMEFHVPEGRRPQLHGRGAQRQAMLSGASWWQGLGLCCNSSLFSRNHGVPQLSKGTFLGVRMTLPPKQSSNNTFNFKANRWGNSSSWKMTTKCVFNEACSLPLNFLKNYLLERSDRHIEKDRDWSQPLVCARTTHNGLGCTEARSQELSAGLPSGCQGSNYLTHHLCLPARALLSELGLKSRHLEVGCGQLHH